MKYHIEFGRVDWCPNLKVWKVIGYLHTKDTEIGRATDRQVVIDILNDWYQENKQLFTGYYDRSMVPIPKSRQK